MCILLYLYISVRMRLVFSLIRAHTFSYTYKWIIFQCVFPPKNKNRRYKCKHTHTQRNYYTLIICIESYAQTVIHEVNKFPKNKQRAVAQCIWEVERKTAEEKKTSNQKRNSERMKRDQDERRSNACACECISTNEHIDTHTKRQKN